MELLLSPQAWAGLLTLTALEIVLGIDNVIFISILAGNLPVASQPRARRIGLFLAMFVRILLLLSLSWIMGLTRPLFSIAGLVVNGRALILIGGGLFLLAKSTSEIHNKMESIERHGVVHAPPSFLAVIVQIVLLDIVFSLDSVITAVGMVDHVSIMIAAIVIAVAVMMIFVGTISRFIDKYPTLKMLALGFLLLIGVSLIADGAGFHIPKGYIYFAMAFSLFIEMLNLKLRDRKTSRLRPGQGQPIT